MRVLLTNDDGIGASGLQALRRALLEIDGIELHVIAPDSNRSATARSITTRSPLWVEEVSFDDGTVGYATEGTPVDCVRFADLGLVGERPELIVSGINHGANLGDDVTYSGTVAAALEGIVARFGARDPELHEALEAAVNPPAEEAPAEEDWRTHWTWLDEETAETVEESSEPASQGNAEEDAEGPSFLPRCYDVRCPVCRSEMEYDSSDGSVKVTARNGDRKAS